MGTTAQRQNTKQRSVLVLDSIPEICKNYYMARGRRKPVTMTERLRVAVNASPLSFQALERETGLLRQTLMKFARGESSLRLDMADKLAEYFGLELTKRKD